jgi:hypothetical protein
MHWKTIDKRDKDLAADQSSFGDLVFVVKDYRQEEEKGGFDTAYKRVQYRCEYGPVCCSCSDSLTLISCVNVGNNQPCSHQKYEADLQTI